MSKTKSVRYFLRLLGGLSVAAVALSTALSTGAVAQVCNGLLTIDQSPPGGITVGQTKTITISIGTGNITGGGANNFTIDRLRYELDCDRSFGTGLPCVNQGNIFNYQGDITISTTCAGTAWVSNLPAGGLSPNQIVFTPSPALVIPANTFPFCSITFTVRLDNLEPLPPDPASDTTPDLVEVVAGYDTDFDDATCDSGLESGQSQSAQVPIVGCGNGVIDPQTGETCDPPGSIPTTPLGNTNPCTSTCTYCGDGVVQAGEQCDTAGPTAGCSAACAVLPICGDGAVNAPGETCDPPASVPIVPPGNTNQCRVDCTYCGDGFVQPGEQCDTAGPSVACTATCTIPPPGCGNGVVDPGETCDPPGSVPLLPPGNTNVCRANCTYCGDTIAQPGETCDVANPTCANGGVCRADCLRCIRNDPALVRFHAGNDRFWLHGRWENIGENLDPTTVAVGIELTNANGQIYATNLNVGDVKQITATSRRTVWRYKNKDAKVNGGIKSFKLTKSGAWYRVTVVAWGDLSLATLAQMRAAVHVGPDDGYANSGVWRALPRGCTPNVNCRGWLIQK